MATKPYYVHSKALREREYFTSVVTRPTGDKRYFSVIDTEIYFGEEYMDDIVRLDYSVEEKKMPIYGFNSYYPSKIVVGQKIIQGTFAVNFTKTGHVNDIIKKISASVYSDELEEISYDNCSEKNRAIWDKSFDMLIGYGYYKHPTENQTYNATCKCLVGCIINGMQEILDTSGEPVMEIYSFIAKDIIFKDFSEVESDYNLTDNSESESSDSKIYLIESLKNDDRIAAMWEYCKNNPTTLGLGVELLHNIKNEKPQVDLKISVYNDRAITIKSAKFTITDQRVKNSITMNFTKVKSFEYKSVIDKTNTSFNFNSDMVNVLKGETNQHISCTLELDIVLEDGEQLQTIKYNTYIYKGLGY